MREEADDEKLLIRYLLGNLPEEQRRQVEGMFLRDDQRYERLLALENELFYDYAQNKLSPGESEQFEKRFLASERNRKRAMLASALLRKMSEAAPVVTIKSGLGGREPRLLWHSLKSSFSAQSMALRLSLATLAIVSLVLIWLVIGTVRLRNEFNQFRAQRASQEDRFQQHLQQERVRADELNLKLKLEIDENAMLKQELSKMKAQTEGPGKRPPSVMSLVLAPSIVRDLATGMKKLSIPPGMRLLKLQLNLKGEVAYKSYQVVLVTVEGVERWSQDVLRAKRTGSGRAIVLLMPTRILIEGDYELRLKGYALDGTLEETGEYYYFSVERK